MVVAAMAMAAVAADPTSADDFDRDGLLFSGYGAIDDVDFENVRERNPRDGECFVGT
jgi:hypothetical protein